MRGVGHWLRICRGDFNRPLFEGLSLNSAQSRRGYKGKVIFMKKISKKLIVFIFIVLSIICVCSFSNALENQFIGKDATICQPYPTTSIVGIIQVVLVAISIIIPMISVIKYLIKYKKLNEEERKKLAKRIRFSIFLRYIFLWFFYNT